MLTLEKASEIVSKLKGIEKIELFCHFEEILNPFPPVLKDGSWNPQAAQWQEMFAEMCDFGIAKNATKIW
jgi:hypothetical protein